MMDGLTLAIIYTFGFALFLAICLAFQLFDELRGNGSDGPGVGAGDGETVFHDGLNNRGRQDDHVG